MPSAFLSFLLDYQYQLYVAGGTIVFFPFINKYFSYNHPCLEPTKETLVSLFDIIEDLNVPKLVHGAEKPEMVG